MQGLFAEGVVQSIVFCPEELLGKFGRYCGVIILTREDIEVGIVGLVREVGADTGSLDKLEHRVPGDTFLFTEVHYRAFAESFHFDELAELCHELLYLLRVPDSFRVAGMEVDA